jgi:hypothetical protein
MTALYLLANEYRAAAMTLADMDLDAQTIADTLEGLSGDLEVKAQNVALMCRGMEANAEACKQWAKEAADRAKAIEARAARLRDYLQRCMEATGIQKIEGPGVALSFRKSTAVAIDEPALIPAEYMRTPEPPPAAPDKASIAAALKAGKDVPGARLEQRQTLQIR